MDQVKPSPKINIWVITTLILALAVLGMYFYYGQRTVSGADGKPHKVLTANEASDKLIAFLNEVYGDRIVATFKEVKEVNGLYKVSVSLADKATNAPQDGDVYVTLDGQVFVPQVMDMAEVLTQARAAQAAIGEQNMDAATGTPSTSTDSQAVPE